jgi:aspartokinase
VARNQVSVIAVAQGASELNICFAVTSSRANDVVRAVHHEFLSPAGAGAHVEPAARIH